MNKVIRDFFNSDLIESEYFGSTHEQLITLKEYLLLMKEKDKKFLELVQEPISALKGKLPWLQDVAFDGHQMKETGEYFSSTIWLFPKDGKHLITKKDESTGVYKDIAERIPKIYSVRKDIRQLLRRQKDLASVQGELWEIDQAGCIYYDGLLYPKKSISECFGIHYSPNIGMYVYGQDELIASYFVRPMKVYDKPYFEGEEKNKVLEKVQIVKD